MSQQPEPYTQKTCPGYSPDIQTQGECRHCGHLADGHEPLPPWAKSKAGVYGSLVQFASLPTKDGRRCGNAVMIGPELRYFQGKEYLVHKVVTDAGNVMRLTGKEVEELFHPAQWVMENLLPAHVKALEEEIHGTEV